MLLNRRHAYALGLRQDTLVVGRITNLHLYVDRLSHLSIRRPIRAITRTTFGWSIDLEDRLWYRSSSHLHLWIHQYHCRMPLHPRQGVRQFQHPLR